MFRFRKKRELRRGRILSTPSGLPPPHRLSINFLHSPYHEALPPASRASHHSDSFSAFNSRANSRPPSMVSSSHHGGDFLTSGAYK